MHTIKAGKLRLHYNSDWSGSVILTGCDFEKEVTMSGKDFVALTHSVVTAFMEE